MSWSIASRSAARNRALFPIRSLRRGVVIRMRLLLIAALIALTGCTVGPNYKRPNLSTPAQLRGADLQPGCNLVSESLADKKWFDLFQDEVLKQLIDRAI